MEKLKLKIYSDKKLFTNKNSEKYRAKMNEKLLQERKRRLLKALFMVDHQNQMDQSESKRITAKALKKYSLKTQKWS